MVLEVNAERLMADMRTLAGFGKHGAGVSRTAYSPPDIEARQWLAARLEEAGLEVGIDNVGNVYGRDAARRSALLVGSHSDSVPMGGWLDGSLGVIYALEIARRAREEGFVGDVGIDVISFQDEEGTYVGWLGSRSVCRELKLDDVRHARSPHGEELADALARLPASFGPEPEMGRWVGYFESHIEQGPILENTRVDVGVVTSIVGIRNYVARFRGRADHAGTTPMNMRQDAGIQMFDFVHQFRAALERVRGPQTVWVFGNVSTKPGFNNTTPSDVELLIQFRDPGSDVLAAIDVAMSEVVDEVSRLHGAQIEIQIVLRTEPVAMNAGLASEIEGAAADVGASSVWMPSGAGHDAAAIGKYIPAAMLFIPSIGGRSHSTEENSHESDIVRGANVALNAAHRMTAMLGRQAGKQNIRAC
ncbi:hydantoinase/carbamoylase family amidase [Aquamicrobium ahrensii]|uniref:N-carbamoyl-L-amino-acid hydrolase n=1 Tax=Aquamicrobium ahrensii TaxID=469551 RepID=A0ABV2KKP8_9HYPH